jgi:ubiquinone/menaquinone biosynthesis C-methylase UbiE
VEAILGAWALDQIVHAGAEHIDPAYVAGYDLKAGYDPTEDVEDLRRRGLDQESIVLDMGCGAGTFALAVAPHCRRVIAVDVSGAMLHEVARRVAQRGVTNVTTVQAGFLTYEHEGAAANVVFTRNALHHLPDFWKALGLARVAAMMAPSGVLWLRDLVYSFEAAETATVFDRWFEYATDDPTTGYTRADLVQHVRGEHSTFTWLLEPMIEHAGFRIASTELHQSRTYARYECVKAPPTP